MRFLPILTLLVLHITQTLSQIIAIDYGTMFIKAALVNSGAGKAFSIVENPKSQRKFINSVQNYLHSSASTMKNDFMKQKHSPRDPRVLPIASSIADCSSTYTKIQQKSIRSGKISSWST